MSATGSFTDLPAPRASRWQPLRAGLVELFYYDYQEFWFRDGRLLLRGNNGTGKSKVLALTLPFLLDGQCTPSRVEPDGDPQKRVEWNLLLGDRYNERTGYSWLEFGRLQADGSTQYFTIGCGMKAVKGRALTTWFFTSDQRVAVDLPLIEARRTPGRERLRELLGERGEVFTTATRYRDAIDTKLFQLGETRYSQLLELLLSLRQPQLSKRPDETALSKALTRALPPLDGGVLREVAEAFRNLEAERQELEALRETAAAVERFRAHNRSYARVAVRRRSSALRSAHSRFEKTRAELSHAKQEQLKARNEETELKTAVERTETELAAGRVRERTLRESPEMRSAEALHRAEHEAQARQRAAAEAARDLQAAEAACTRLASQLEARQGRSAQMRDRVRVLAERLAAHAEHAGIATEHRQMLQQLPLEEGPDGTQPVGAEIERARRQADAMQRRRGEQIARLVELIDALDTAVRKRTTVQQNWQEVHDGLERLLEQQAEADSEADAKARELHDACARWMQQCRELRIDEQDKLLATFEEWTRSLHGDNPVLAAANRAFDTAQEEMVSSRAALRQRKAEQQARRSELLTERERLEAGEELAPPVPHTRGEDVRRTRAGAPLWTLIDFREEVPATARAGLEAALEGAGLLDAWVQPGGTVLDAATWDIVLLAEANHATALPAPAPADAAPALDRVLRPAIDAGDAQAAAVARHTVQAVLAAIGWGESAAQTWVDGNGRWRHGMTEGAWGKPRAEYIGRGARDAARRRRLARIGEEMAALDTRIGELDAELATLQARRAQLDAERRELPDHEALLAAHRQCAELRHLAQERRQHLQAVGEELLAARKAAEELGQSLETTADILRLPAQAQALSAVRGALADYRTEASALWPSLESHWDGLSQLDGLRAEIEEARLQRERQDQRRHVAERAASAASTQRDILRETVGEAVATVQRRLAQAVDELERLETQTRQLRKDELQIARRISSAATRVETLQTTLVEQHRHRRDTIDALRELAVHDLLNAAFPERPAPMRDDTWSPDHAVHLARGFEKELQEVDESDAAWHAQQHQLMERFTDLQNALSRHGHSAGGEPHGELYVVRVVFQSRSCDTEELARMLAAESRERTELLDARERELLEEHLVNDLASHLQGRIQQAEAAAERMNAELERRPTGTGMKLRLRWKPLEDGESWLGHVAPDGLNEARRRLLRQSAEVWSVEDRRAVGSFLKKRIDDARAAELAAALPEVLERALDYRYWHRFVIERWQDGVWRPAMGPASGGERALVVTVPLFAAASSHYSSAGPHAPRLVLLDEAFAGIDDESRARCMGLLAHFDMDVMMTSEREWGCYPEVPGLAIAQLTRREDVDAVHVSTWWWDGKQRTRAVQPMPDLETLERASASA